MFNCCSFEFKLSMEQRKCGFLLQKPSKTSFKKLRKSCKLHNLSHNSQFSSHNLPQKFRIVSVVVVFFFVTPYQRACLSFRYQTLKTMLNHISKHLKVYQKYSAVHCIFKSLLGLCHVEYITSQT